MMVAYYFGETGDYYLDPNYGNGSWYIYLPKFRVDDTSAYFSGTLQSPGGTIGGFSIGTSSIYKSKTAYSNSTAGVYVGTDGIGLGEGTFYVTSAGALTATSGAIGAWSITSSYYRCVRAWFKNLCYESVSGKWTLMGDFYLGPAYLFDVKDEPGEGRTMNNLLYVAEEVYAKLEDAEDKLLSEEHLVFKGFCDDIFADG